MANLPNTITVEEVKEAVDSCGPDGTNQFTAVGGIQNRGEQFYQLRRITMMTVKNLAITSGDPTSVALLGKTRKFIINNDLVDHSYVYAGRSFLVASGDIVGISPGEAEFILTKAAEAGHNVVPSSLVDWLISGGETQFLYW